MGEGNTDKKTEIGVEDHRLELLMTYTIFHIGLYMSMVAALLATEKGFGLFNIIAIRVAVGLLLLAGVCGGLIAVNVAEFDPEKGISKFFDNYELRLWDAPRRWIPTYKYLGRIEHVLFWASVIVLIIGYCVEAKWPQNASKEEKATTVIKCEHCWPPPAERAGLKPADSLTPTGSQTEEQSASSAVPAASSIDETKSK